MEIQGIIKKLASLLGSAPYVFIGSANMFLQGVLVEPHDIDILTTPDGIKEIDKLLQQYRTKEIYFDDTEKRNSFRSFYHFEGWEIDVLGDVDNAYRSRDSLSKKVILGLSGTEIPCLDLAEELEAYKKMGREDKVALLSEYLKG